MLLDVSAAFHTVDHHTLIHRQNPLVGISGTAPEWFSLDNVSLCGGICVRMCSSASWCSPGIGPGSPLLSLYMLPLGQISSHFDNISSHLYAESHELSSLNNCIDTHRAWMANKFLQLNADKTEVIPESLHSDIKQHLGGLFSSLRSSLRYLCLFFLSNHKLQRTY